MPDTNRRLRRDNKEFGYAERFNNWIARNKPGNDGPYLPGNDDPYLSFSPQAGIQSGGVSRRLCHALRDNYLPLSSQKDSLPSDSPLSPQPVILAQAEKTALPAVILAEGGNPVKYLSRVA